LLKDTYTVSDNALKKYWAVWPARNIVIICRLRGQKPFAKLRYMTYELGLLVKTIHTLYGVSLNLFSCIISLNSAANSVPRPLNTDDASCNRKNHVHYKSHWQHQCIPCIVLIHTTPILEELCSWIAISPKMICDLIFFARLIVVWSRDKSVSNYYTIFFNLYYKLHLENGSIIIMSRVND